MSDFRMNKSKPVGDRNQSTIMGWNVQRKTKPNQVSSTPAPVAPDDAAILLDADRPFEVIEPLVADADVSLGDVITIVEEEELVDDNRIDNGSAIGRASDSEGDLSTGEEEAHGDDREIDEPSPDDDDEDTEHISESSSVVEADETEDDEASPEDEEE